MVETLGLASLRRTDAIVVAVNILGTFSVRVLNYGCWDFIWSCSRRWPASVIVPVLSQDADLEADLPDLWSYNQHSAFSVCIKQIWNIYVHTFCLEPVNMYGSQQLQEDQTPDHFINAVCASQITWGGGRPVSVLWQFHGNVFHGSWWVSPAPVTHVGGWRPSWENSQTMPKSCHYYASESYELVCHGHGAPIPETSVFHLPVAQTWKSHKCEHMVPGNSVM